MSDNNNSIFEVCKCKAEFMVEKREDHYVLYLGRCGHKHGYNLAKISDLAYNFDLNGMLRKLNEE